MGIADYDLDDQQVGNHQYNEIGQLIADAGEDIDQITSTFTERCNRKYIPQTDCFSMLCCISQRQDKFVLLFLDAIMFRIEIIGDPDLRQRTLSAYIW
ncbi:MAG: hypothetical protein JNM00_05545 [Flavobacteriales bacterium]|nr:hypothetical protein [Flavobacteriales bacterium]